MDLIILLTIITSTDFFIYSLTKTILGLKSSVDVITGLQYAYSMYVNIYNFKILGFP